ncbi:MAG: Gfo/Idh/MocA family oxidoreductase, partial [Planctomycetes bacterium]|nr:Gfo/Idh/MocA family oxidoreductase [Planctomycetota bacterium]
MSRPIRIVIFGNGFARTVVLPCLRHVDGVEVVGIASPGQERLRETAREFGIARFDADHRSLLEATEPDLAIVCTPPHRHLDQATDALAAGCHVICEKPTALNATESETLCEAAAAHPDRITLIDHELRFDPKRRELGRQLRDGAIGRPLRATYTVESHWRRDPKLPWTWFSDAACGGGALGALGSHAIDSLRALLGEVDLDSVRGRLDAPVRQRTDGDGRRRDV